ncbi:hypothetical protein, partial [uncultured Duncaniella sp.]|uniref:hypothetical protein n=1 Tax=uncultured Duncaniella sp. TaxID=2768039 RepID=UPI0026705B0C
MRRGGGCFCVSQAVRHATERPGLGAWYEACLQAVRGDTVGLRRDGVLLPVVLELSLQLLPCEEYA